MHKYDNMAVPEFLLEVPIFYLKFTTGFQPTNIAYIKRDTRIHTFDL